MNFQEDLIYLAKTRMPFGKYEGRYLTELPEAYLVWFKNKGFPAGKLGNALAMMYELQANGVPKEFYIMVNQLRQNS